MTNTLIVGLLAVTLGLGRHSRSREQPYYVVDALPIVNKTICTMPISFLPLMATHAYYAATYFAPLYPNIYSVVSQVPWALARSACRHGERVGPQRRGL